MKPQLETSEGDKDRFIKSCVIYFRHSWKKLSSKGWSAGFEDSDMAESQMSGTYSKLIPSLTAVAYGSNILNKVSLFSF